MNKVELEELINKLQHQLKDAQEQLEEVDKYKRFKPKNNEMYYCIDNFGSIFSTPFLDTCSLDRQRYDFYNCFKTNKEAQREVDKILIRRKLEALARCLNGKKVIDWDNTYQRKYYIEYNCIRERLRISNTYNIHTQGVVYCLSENFLDEAIKEIGERELIKYIRIE